MEKFKFKSWEFFLPSIIILAFLFIILISPAYKLPKYTPETLRDQQRIKDIDYLSEQLQLYSRQNKILLPSEYNENDINGWDYSSQNNFLTFLKANLVRKDSINNGEGNVFEEGSGFAYGFYVDIQITGSHSSPTFSIGAKLENGGFYIITQGFSLKK